MAVATPAVTAIKPIDTQAIVRDAIKKVSALATLPEVTARIIKTVEDPKSSAGQLHKIVSHDPALVTRILKVVNSAFYGLPGQVGSIERAIVLLGLNAVKNIAVAASLGQLFRGIKLCEGFTAKDLWTHCIAVGVTAREIAKAISFAGADEAFLAGMIHDVGILVELQTSPEQTRKVCQTVLDSGGDFCLAERTAMHVDHQTLGKALAEAWKFPISCQQVAGFHHNPLLADDESRKLVTVVYAADIICCQANRGFSLTAKHQEFNEIALQEAGITEAVLEKIKLNLEASVCGAVSVFG
jgi:HD-like signal output (HDOD) protein